jgi:hypothetical protein
MDATLIQSINFAIKEIVIYFCIPSFIMGVIGEILNIIVFLSLKTFRQSSCAFYLMIMSTSDIGRLFLGVLPFIMRWGFGTDWGTVSLFFCKIRCAIFTISTLISMTCLCLATIDQYFATCTRPSWQQWCNIKLAHRLAAIFIIIWILHGIPYLVFFNHVVSPLTNQTTCENTNAQLNGYVAYGYLILNNILALITVVFGLMAYHNARNLAHRTVPLVRRELDKQLTVMVLVQVLINFCTYLPFSIGSILITLNIFMSNFANAIIYLVSTIATNFYILSFVVRISSIILNKIQIFFCLFSLNFRVDFIHIFVCRNDFVDN